MKYPSKALEQLVIAFSNLPGIGEKSAQRIALYILKEGKDDGEFLANAIHDLRTKITSCGICFNYSDEDPCSICSDHKRSAQLICVVEEPKDLLAIERTGAFNGKYHVLGGNISPLEGISEEKLNVQELLERVKSGEVKEVILANNPTVEGEMTASRLLALLKPFPVKVTRIARGVPFGGSLEFNDTLTVSKALEGRSEL